MADRQRTLVVVRHAKSAWPLGVDDDQRPLSERGRRDAPAVGRWLVDHNLVPEVGVVSPAVRTQETWRLLSAQFPSDVASVTADEIYAADWEDLLGVLRSVPDDRSRVALVGHNPGCEELAAALAGPDSDEAALARVREKYPTAGVAVLQMAGSWAQLAAGSAALTDFAAPRG